MVRETLWGDVVPTISTLAAASTAVLINVTGAGFLALRPFTVVRLRGYLSIESDQTAAAEFQALNFGAAVVSDQAVAIGITAVPTPTTDMGSDAWFAYETLMSSMNAGAGDGQLRSVQKDYDSKAMRRTEDGFQVIFVVESGSGGTTTGLVVRHQARLLIKLH